MELKSKQRTMWNSILVFHDVFKTSFLVAESLGRVVSEIKMRNVVAFLWTLPGTYINTISYEKNIFNTVG